MGSRGIGGEAGFDQGHHPPQPCPTASAIDSASAAAAHTASKAARADRSVGVPSLGVLWLIGSYSIPAPSLSPLRCNLAFSRGRASDVAGRAWGLPRVGWCALGQRISRELSLRNYECAGLSGQLSAIAAPGGFPAPFFALTICGKATIRPPCTTRANGP